MNISTVKVILFSPAGSTEKVGAYLAEQIAAALQIPWSADSFTLPSERIQTRHFTSSDLVIFSVPTYAGRVPNKILPSVQTLFLGENTPAIPLVTFGNRSYDNALRELRNELQAHGFYPIAAAALASRHVFSGTLGRGRPDQKDLKLLRGLAGDIAEKLAAATDLRELPSPVLPENDTPIGPYYTPRGTDGQPTNFLKATPVTDPAQCDHCGTCATVCPMGSVSSEHPEETTGICIKCQACILKCPRHARRFTDPAFLSHKEMMEKTYQRRADSVIFLA